MLLPDGYHDVPAGALAAVVTYLEMTAAAPARPERAATSWTLRPVTQPGLDWYRDLYRRVGADWLWSSRLSLSDADLAAVLGAPGVVVQALMVDGRDEGLLELDFRVPDECELAFFGVTPSLVGQGAGRWLMNRALALAWSQSIRRFWLHTCTLDAPEALPFYVRSGFAPYARKVEVYDDPRLAGVLPPMAAPQVPVITPSR
jgi:GNAT superfamily N-acetyltransferase